MRRFLITALFVVVAIPAVAQRTRPHDPRCGEGYDWNNQSGQCEPLGTAVPKDPDPVLNCTDPVTGQPWSCECSAYLAEGIDPTWCRL